MATKGTFTAYQQLNPLQGSIADDMANQELLGFKRRAEQREIDEIAQEKADKKKKEKQQLIDSVVKNIQNYNSGSRSLDEIKGRAIQRAMDEYGPIIETLENPNSSSDQILKAKLKLQNLHNLPENMKMVTDFFTEQDKVYREGVAKGTLFKNNEYEAIFQEGFGNYHIDIDENGLPVVALMKQDINKDGKIDIYDVQDFQQIKTGLPTFNFQNRYDYEDLLKDATTKIQPEVNQTDNGVVQNKTTGLNLIKAKTYAEGLFLKKDGSPTPEMMSIAKERGIDITKPENQQEIINDFVSAMSLRTKSGSEDTRKYSALDWQKEQRAAAKDAKDEVKTGVVEIKTSLSDNFINKKVGKETLYTNGIGVSSNKIQFKNLGGDKSGLNSGYIETFTKDKKTGDIIVIGKALKTKGKTFKVGSNTFNFSELETEAGSGNQEAQLALNKYQEGDNYGSFVRRVGEEEVAPLVMQAGFGSPKELKNELDRLNPKKSRKYSSVEESAIQQAMKDNPGVSRETIIKALGL